MSLLNTFFLRYRADTGQAVRDVNRLNDAEERESRTHTRAAAERTRASGAIRESLRQTETAARGLGSNLASLSTGGSGKLAALRGAAGSLSEVVGSIGPAGFAAAAGIGAIIAAVSVANAGVDKAREGAKEAIALGEQAYAAKLSQGELIRLQTQGRVRGLSDEQTSASASGVNQRGEEIRAAQRQAGRDPASAFNNPLIKQASLWKKAGVDVNAALETQIAQQDKYLRALKERGQEERALIEGVQLFGRTLGDVKSVLSTTQEQINQNALAMAKSNSVRRDLQVSAEKLSTAEGVLDGERKKTDERIRSHTTPATIAFTEALTDWHRATSPLKDLWSQFVSELIQGIADIIRAGTNMLSKLGLADDTRTPDQRIEDQVRAKVMNNEDLYGRLPGHKKPGEAGFDEARAAFLKDIGDKERERLSGPAREAENKRKAGLAGTAQQAADEMVANGTMTREQADAAAKKAIEQGMGDSSVSKLEDIKLLMQESNEAQGEAGKVQKAQTDYTKKIEANTMALVNTGLEQAMALWAANVGKGAGVGSGGFQGETQGDYEQRVRAMQRSINPNAAQSLSMDRKAVGEMSQQAGNLNRAKDNSKGGDQSKTVNIDNLNVEVSSAKDVSGLAQDVGVGIRDELRYAAAEFASPVVS